MNKLEKLSNWLNKTLAWVAGGALIVMMTLSVANIVLRLAHRPLGGTAEAVGWLAALTAAFALGYTQIHRGHVAIDFLVERLPRGPRAVVDTLTSFAATAFFALAAWRVASYAHRLGQLGKLSETMHISFFPFTYAVAFGFACFALVLLVDGLKSVKGVIQK
ncbi:MAG: TRAP transporter small permease [Bacillota bacterium]